MQQFLKSKTLLFILLSLSFLSARAQECDTQDIQPEVAMNYPWFGNPNYLPQFMDSLQNTYSSPNAKIENGIIWRISIQLKGN